MRWNVQRVECILVEHGKIQLKKIISIIMGGIGIVVKWKKKYIQLSAELFRINADHRGSNEHQLWLKLFVRCWLHLYENPKIIVSNLTICSAMCRACVYGALEMRPIIKVIKLATKSLTAEMEKEKKNPINWNRIFYTATGQMLRVQSTWKSTETIDNPPFNAYLLV